MLGGEGHDPPPLVARPRGEAGGALDRHVVALGGARGEHDLLARRRRSVRRSRPARPPPPPPPRWPIACSTLCGLANCSSTRAAWRPARADRPAWSPGCRGRPGGSGACCRHGHADWFRRRVASAARSRSPCAHRRAAKRAGASPRASQGSETRIAAPASAPQAHRRQHRAARHLAGGTGRPGAHRDAGEVERDHLGLGRHAGQSKAAGIRQPRRPGPAHDRALAAIAAPRSGRAARRAWQPSVAAAAAAARPAIAGSGSVPPRLPRSWPPPAISAAISSPGRSSSAPAPAGPPSLWPETARLSPRAAGCTAPSGRLHRIDMQQRALRPAERRGLRQRVQHAGLVVRRHQADQRRAARPAAPPARRGRRCRPAAPGSPPAPAAAASTAGCSVAPTSSRRPRPRRLDRQRIRLRPARGEDDVPGRAPKRAATASRASSSRRRAARPAAWTEDGLPPAPAPRSPPPGPPAAAARSRWRRRSVHGRRRS